MKHRERLHLEPLVVCDPIGSEEQVATTIWLVRHGETTANADGIFQGHLDIDLNERGERQAAAVGAYLANISFDGVYASDLLRAARTAEIIVAGRHVVDLDPDLREMHYGVLQGVRYREAGNVLDGHGLGEAWRSGAMHRRGTAPPGGESLRQFRIRSRRFVQRLDAQHPPSEHHDMLVVAHGGKLSVLLSVLLGLPSQARHAFRFSNCGISKAVRAPARTTLDLHNLVVWDGQPLRAYSQTGQQLDPGESRLPRT